MPSLVQKSNAKAGGRKRGLLGKLKEVFTPGSSARSLKTARTHSRDDSESLGAVATRTRSRISMFGSREAREAAEAEREQRELEERKSKCLAIKAAKRDPPAVQRLLVDCEFCNPPQRFGRVITIESPGFTAAAAEASLQRLEELRGAGADLGPEREWNEGLDEWLHMRDWWLTPTADAQPVHHLDADLTQDKYYTVYDKLIYQTRPLKHPLNLADVVKIVKAGWVGEGSWPDGSDNDVWSTTDDDETRELRARLAQPAAPNESSPHEHSEHEHAHRPDEHAQQHPPYPGAASNGHAPPAPAPKINIVPTSPLSSGVPSAATSQLSLRSGGPQHVQFSERPHPRELSPQATSSMPRLERVQSSTGGPLRPVVSAQSSVISITDSE